MIKALIITLAITLPCAAFGAESKVISRKDLPAALKGGKAAQAAKVSDGIPSCRAGRAVLPATDDTVKVWASEPSHAKHPCLDAETVYVCRAFGALSVRCE